MRNFTALLLAACLAALGSPVYAAGMVPETSVVLLDAGAGEATINVTNSDSEAVLLYTSLENLLEDQEELVFVTSPIQRVEAGEKQLVRFIFQSTQPLTTQRLKRVIFEGIPQQRSEDKNHVKMTLRQNLPVVISPAGLPENKQPWALLKWAVDDRTLVVRNDSPYVVRLSQQLELLPAGTPLVFPRTYILPGQIERLALPAGVHVTADSKVRLYPASLYGYQGDAYDAPLVPQ